MELVDKWTTVQVIKHLSARGRLRTGSNPVYGAICPLMSSEVRILPYPLIYSQPFKALGQH